MDIVSTLSKLKENKLVPILIIIWVLVMVALPIIRSATGERFFYMSVTVSVLVQATVVLVIVQNAWGWSRTLQTLLIVAVLTWLVEALGSATGLPFGQYSYTDNLQPQLVHVPLIIPLAWFMMLPPTWAIAQTLTKQRGLTFMVISATAFTAWDLFLDPQMVAWNLFEQIFKQGRPPDDPTIYLAITSKSDPQDAPPGCENWFVLVNAPALDERYEWAAHKLAYGERILAKLAEWGLGVSGRIRHQTIFTPHDLARQTGAWRGALYGASANSRWTAFRRPHNRCPDYRGLYFAGGTTHPGGGVPMVTLSGKVAAQLLLDDDGANFGG